MGLGRRISRLLGGKDRDAGDLPRSAGKASVALGAAPGLAPGEVVYAIGDVHGRADLLDRLIGLIAHDLTDEARATLIFLGDYVDRGEESRGVIDHCISLAAEFQGRTVFLKGNHEDAMLNFLIDPVRAANWLTFGGLATLMSYGVRGVSEKMSEAGLEDARDQLAEHIPDSHLEFLERLLLTHSIDSHFFCHAGVEADRPLDEQSPAVLMWGEGRQPGNYHHAAKTVVHGHYVTDAPVVAANRVSVDTGAYYSGRLTALKLTADSADFIST